MEFILSYQFTAFLIMFTSHVMGTYEKKESKVFTLLCAILLLLSATISKAFFAAYVLCLVFAEMPKIKQ